MTKRNKIYLSVGTIIFGWLLNAFAWTTKLGHPTSTFSLLVGLGLFISGLILFLTFTLLLIGSLAFATSSNQSKLLNNVVKTVDNYSIDSKLLKEWIKRLFTEESINYTEGRAAMHWALRLPKDDQDYPELAEQVHQQLDRMYQLVEKIHAGQCRGATGEVIQDVVNIGVGGSDLGPLMVSHALSDYKVSTAKPLKVHFVSTMDGSQLSDLLHQLRPETTLFIISSKSFGTIDTLSNAQTVRHWLEKDLGTQKSVVQHHFIGVSTKPEKMTEWGIAEDNQFLLWDWVGGRYSLWSCIGLPIALQIGIDGFKQLLAGAYAIDQHFQKASFEQNIPVLMGLLGVWNNNFLNIQTHAVLPYDGRLKYFASYLQQLEMESNGKSIQRNN